MALERKAETQSGGDAPNGDLKLAIVIAAFAVAIVVSTEFIVVGILPALAGDLHISLAEAGHFVSWYAISAAIFGPLLTILLSRSAPHRVLAAVLFVFAVGNLTIVLTPTYAVIVGVRVVQGATLPLFVAISTAAVARLAGAERAGLAITRVSIGFVAAAVFAVPAGVALADVAGWLSSFMVLGVLAALAMVAIAGWFPRLDGAGLASFVGQAQILRQPQFLVHLVLSAVLFTGIFAAYTYLAGFLQLLAGFDGREVALGLMGFGLSGLIGNYIAGRVTDRSPLLATIGVAVALFFSLVAVSLVGGRLVLLIPVLVVWGAAHTASFVIGHVRTMFAAPHAAAFAGSLNISVSNLGVAAGAVAGGYIVDHYGIVAIGYGGAVFTGLAICIALAMHMTAPSQRRRQDDKLR